MNIKLTQKTILTLALAAVVFTVLSGCGRSAETPSSVAPQGSTSVTVTSSSENSEEVSSAGEEAEDIAPVNSEENDTPSDGDGDTPATNTSAPDETPSDVAAEPVAAEPDAGAAAPTPEESQTVAPESGSLSGIDLTVRFGDDGAPFVLHLYDNETAAAIARHVGTADWRLPIYNYDGYDNWEVMQYYDIPSRYEIPSNPQSITSEQAGTVYYSEPNRIVLFFGDANVSSEYTPVGYIDYSQEFADAVENNPVLEGWGNKIVNISRED